MYLSRYNKHPKERIAENQLELLQKQQIGPWSVAAKVFIKGGFNTMDDVANIIVSVRSGHNLNCYEENSE